MNTPLVSIIMPIFNAQNYLHQSIQSLLRQTHSHFELFLFDDGSTDSSLAIAQSFNDPRIQIFSDGTNKGQPVRYNTGIQLAKGKYIAIAHADDVALPNRLEYTVAFLEENDEYGIVGGQVELIDNQGNKLQRKYGIAGDHDFLFLHQLFACPLMHTTILARRELLLAHPYNLTFDSCEDYEIFARCSLLTKMYNLDQPLTLYRLHPNNLTKTKRATHALRIQSIMQNLYAAIGLEYAARDFEFHLLNFYFHKANLSITEIQQIEAWLMDMRDRLRSLNRFDENLIDEVLFINWLAACKKGRGVGWRLIHIFKKSPLAKGSEINFKQQLVLFSIALPQNSTISQVYTWLRTLTQRRNHTVK
ncbi:MAG: glycosyltransferase [Bacteroidota bacterium]